MSYFHNDCLAISDAALVDVDVFKNIGALVLLSIQQPFITMPRQMADVWQKGRESRYLFGHKRAGYDFLQVHAKRLQRLAGDCKASGDLDSLIIGFLEMPNLGIVKASFFAQMAIGDGACLDTHNLTRLGLAETFFRMPKTLKLDSVHKRIRTYNTVWRNEGDSAYWWNSWCDHVAKQTRNKFTSGAMVSRFHRLTLGEQVE
jgi:hypothetical protein